MQEASGIYQTQLDLNYHKKNYTLSGGLYYYQIGGINYPMVTIEGKFYL